MNDAERRCAKLRQEIEDIQDDDTLSHQDKREYINDALAEIKEIQREAAKYEREDIP